MFKERKLIRELQKKDIKLIQLSIKYNNLSSNNSLLKVEKELLKKEILQTYMDIKDITHKLNYLLNKDDSLFKVIKPKLGLVS